MLALGWYVLRESPESKSNQCQPTGGHQQLGEFTKKKKFLREEKSVRTVVLTRVSLSFVARVILLSVLDMCRSLVAPRSPVRTVFPFFSEFRLLLASTCMHAILFYFELGCMQWR